MTGIVSIRLYSAVFAGLMLTLAVAATLLPHDPYIRIQAFNGTLFAGAKPNYERLHFVPRPVDVAFLGSSRTIAGVDSSVLEQLLAARGMNLNVVNLALPASGMDLQLAQAREVLEAHPETRVLVVSVVERLPRDGHQAFGDYATASEVVSAPLLGNRHYPENLLKLPMRQIRLFFATRLPDAFGYSREFTGGNGQVDPSGWQPVRPAHPYDSPEHAAALRAETKMRNAEMRPPILPSELAALEFGVARSSIDRIVALARANGTQVAFLFLPFYEGWDAPEEVEWLEQRGPVWAIGEIRQTPRYYNDAAHPSEAAVPLINTILADRVASLLGNGAGSLPRGQEGSN
jgi:hypothetical protein